jgi:hypothetical protein
MTLVPRHNLQNLGSDVSLAPYPISPAALTAYRSQAVRAEAGPFKRHASGRAAPGHMEA